MDGARTRGQAAALDAVASMIRGPAPQAVLFVGPDGVVKTTLALDLAACCARPRSPTGRAGSAARAGLSSTATTPTSTASGRSDPAARSSSAVPTRDTGA